MILKVKKLYPNSAVPFRATSGSAGMDLKAYLSEPVTIEPGERKLIPTGIAISLQSADYVAYIFARSGLAIKLGITLSNCVGVIDSDYRGELKIGLINQSNEPYVVNHGERIAQLVISPVINPEIVLVDELDNTERSDGGFGSTGKA